MNANELANVLEVLHEQDKADGFGNLAMPEAATMLRQQQNAIEALKQSKSDVNSKVKMKETTEEYIAKLKAGLATLETALYEVKMSAQEVNTRKNKQIAEQQAEIEILKNALRNCADLIKKAQEK